MKLKRLAAITLGMVMSCSTAAYAADAAAVAAYQEMEAVSKAQTDMDAYYDYVMLMDDGTGPIETHMEMNTKANHLTEPEQIRMSSYVRMTMQAPAAQTGADADSKLVMTESTYYEDGMYYIDILGTKTKMAMPLAEMMKSMESANGIMSTNLDMLQDLQLLTSGDQRVLTYTMDASRMNEAVDQVFGASGLGALMKETGADFAYRDISGEYVLDQEGHCTKARFKAAMDTTADGKTVTVTMEGDVGFANPGQPVEITAPDLSAYTLSE